MIYNARMDMAELTKEQRDMVLLGIIKTITNDSKMAQRSKKVNN